MTPRPWASTGIWATCCTNSAIGGQSAPPLRQRASRATNPLGLCSRHPSPSPFTLTGILTDPQYRVVLKALQQRSGTELLAQPEVTTSSGRQAQCKMVNVQSVVTGIDERALTPPGITSTNEDESALYATEQMEFGPILDITPTVLADGYTIALTVIPTVTRIPRV